MYTDYRWRFNTRSVVTEQNKNAMTLGGPHEVSWWSQSRPQWTLFIKKEKQNLPHRTNWHPCWHCQQQGQGYNGHRKRVFQGHCWDTIGKWHDRETVPVPWAVRLPLSLCQACPYQDQPDKNFFTSVTSPMQLFACQNPLQE